MAPTSTNRSRHLTGGVVIVVATPGKLLSHLNLGYVPVQGIEFLILDEADRMMDMGFVDDINRIITFLPKERQNADVQRHDAARDPRAVA
jgi:ATP-dependent RNA helicase RhlE